jgi:hypothetical protein
VTLGPKGRNVGLDQSYGAPKLTKVLLRFSFLISSHSFAHVMTSSFCSGWCDCC